MKHLAILLLTFAIPALAVANNYQQEPPEYSLIIKDKAGHMQITTMLTKKQCEIFRYQYLDNRPKRKEDRIVSAKCVK